MTPELKPLFGSPDRRGTDRPSDRAVYFRIAASAVSGLLLWSLGESTLAILPVCLALHWSGGWLEERQPDLMDYFRIATIAVLGLVFGSRGWWLAIPPIGLALLGGFMKWRERRFNRS